MAALSPRKHDRLDAKSFECELSRHGCVDHADAALEHHNGLAADGTGQKSCYVDNVIATVVQDGPENLPFRLECRNDGNSSRVVQEFASGHPLCWTDNQADETGKQFETGDDLGHGSPLY
jgi:hypothetical protein